MTPTPARTPKTHEIAQPQHDPHTDNRTPKTHEIAQPLLDIEDLAGVRSPAAPNRGFQGFA